VRDRHTVSEQPSTGTRSWQLTSFTRAGEHAVNRARSPSPVAGSGATWTLSEALPGNDLVDKCLLGNGLLDDRAKRPLDLLAAVVDVVQVERHLPAAIVRPRPCGRETGTTGARGMTERLDVLSSRYCAATSRPRSQPTFYRVRGRS